MRDFLDTEFDGFGGSLVSLALVSENGPNLHLIHGLPAAPDPFAHGQVQPKLESVPKSVATIA